MSGNLIAIRGGNDPTLVNANRGVLHIVAHKENRFRTANVTARTHGPQQLPQPHTYRHLDPVGIETMPSQSVHIPEQLYEYVITTKADDQSTSARVTELVRKGKTKEETQ